MIIGASPILSKLASAGLSLDRYGNVIIAGSVAAGNVWALPGKTYYVDASVSASGSGRSWATAFKTLAEAITQVNSDAGAHATIIVAPGTYAESLTPPTVMCSIVGAGWLGKTSMPLIAPASGSCFVGAMSALRLANLRLKVSTASKNVLDLTTVADTMIEDCLFISNNPTTGAVAIDIATSMFDSTIRNCYFTTLEGGTAQAFTKGIVIAEAMRNFIVNNIFTGLADDGTGIEIAGHDDPVFVDNVVAGNIVYVSSDGTCINDGDSKSLVFDNLLCHTGGTAITSLTGATTRNMSNDGTNMAWVAPEA